MQASALAQRIKSNSAPLLIDAHSRIEFKRVFLDQRLKNGWKNSGLPWTYDVNPDIVYQDPVDMLKRNFPILNWGAEYSRRTLVNDLVVAAIATIMLIPQREAEKEAKTGI